MAEFGDTSISPIQGQTDIPAPVVDRSGLVSSQAISTGVTQLAGLATGLLDQIKKGNIDKSIQGFAQAQLSIADAVEQGAISSAEGRTRMRANFTRAIADNPSLLADFGKVHKDIITTSGLGKVVAEGTAEEQQLQKLMTEAAQNGFVQIDGSTGQQDLAEYMEYKEAVRELEFLQKKQTFTKGQVDLTSSKISLGEKVKEVESRKALTRLAVTHMPLMRNRVNDIISRFERNAISQDEALKMLDIAESEVEATVSATGGGFNLEYASSLAKPFDMVVNTAREVISGDRDKKTLQNSIDNALGLAQLNLINDNPELTNKLAASRLVGTGNVGLDLLIKEEVLKAFANSQDTTVDVVGLETEDQKDLMDALKEGVNTVLRGGSTEEDVATQEEVSSKLTNIVKGISAFETLNEDPKKFQNVVNFLASPEYGKYAEIHGGVPSDVAADAADVLKANYSDVVMPLIKKELDQTSIGSLIARDFEDIPLRDLVKPEFTGAGVRLIPNEKSLTILEGKIGRGQFQSDLGRRLRDLNKRLAGPLNKVVRMSAHLSGTRNYEKVWREIYEPIVFPPLDEQEVVRAHQPDEGGAGKAPFQPPDDLRGIGGATEKNESPLSREDQATSIVKGELLSTEGVGDLLTGIPTGEGGITVDTKKALEKDLGRSLTDQEAREAFVDQGHEKLSESLVGYKEAPPELQVAALDTGFNVGFGNLIKFPKFKKAVKDKNWEEAAKQLLDTANVDNKSVKGIALRRARQYNRVAEVPIKFVEQKEDGTIIYVDENNNIVLSYKPKEGKHPNSRAEVEEVF